MSRAGGAYVLLTGPPSLMFHKERGPSLPTWGPCSAPQGRAKVARLAPVLKTPSVFPGTMQVAKPTRGHAFS